MKLVGLDSLLVWPGGVSLGFLGLMCKYRIKSEVRQSEGKRSEILFGLILLFLKLLLESQKVAEKTGGWGRG